MAASAVKQGAQALQAELDKDNGGNWSVSVRADGRALIYTYRLKPVATDDGFYRAQGAIQKQLLELYCSGKYWNERDLEVTEYSHILQFPG